MNLSLASFHVLDALRLADGLGPAAWIFVLLFYCVVIVVALALVGFAALLVWWIWRLRKRRR
jgi:hypothetical protein